MIRRALLGLAVILGLTGPSAALPPQDEKEELKERTHKHKADVTEIRGLEFKRDVTVGLYSKKELQAFLEGEFEKELPKEKAERYQRGFAKFGLLPKDLDLHQALLDLFGSSIAGFYHPKTKELRLIRAGDDGEEQKALKAMGIDVEAITLVHELTHAAQDQNFELSTLPLEDETNDDLVAAIKGVIEGDASAVGWKYGLKEKFDLMIGLINGEYKTGKLPGDAAKLPAYLRLTLTFPYGHGTDFILKYMKNTEGDLKDISKLFKDFPLSTEQILHPAKYYDKRDNPILVTLPDLEKLFGAPWKESFNNVHGEFAINILLKELKGEKLRLPVIRKASEGWGGDRYVVLEDGQKNAMYVWYSTWDSAQDAKEFYETYAVALEQKYEVPVTEEGRGDKTSFTTKQGEAYLELKGKDVLVLDGATAAMLAKTGDLWKDVKKKEITGVERLNKFVCAPCNVKKAFSGKCPTCGAELKYEDDKDKKEEKKDDKKPKKEYR